MTHATTMMAQMPMWQDGGHVMGLHWGWWTFWIVLLALLVWGVARGLGGPGRTTTATEATSAEETLRRRFAAGEIDEEEFNRRLEALKGDGQS